MRRLALAAEHRSDGMTQRPLQDGLGRAIRYLRLSVTDRCDMRCTYCMAETMQFTPTRELLSLDEMDRLASAFINRGVRKLRLTGGEPLVRAGVIDLINRLGRHLRTGALDELTLTTNGSQLARHADALAAAGVRRINVSLDSLNPRTYAKVTRGASLQRALDGIAAAQSAGMAVKINAVALLQDNADEIPALLRGVHALGCDLTLIEVMPMGDIGFDRADQFLSLKDVKAQLAKQFTLVPSSLTTGGPARYWQVSETGRQLGLISPLTQNFCDGCNRVRVSAKGQLYLCLGHMDGADLRSPLRTDATDAALHRVLDAALAHKPRRHEFDVRPGARPAVIRFMSATGG